MSSEPLRILSIGAHPADIFDQSGGTMVHHIRRGDWVGCCVLTHGARVHDKVLSNDMFHRETIPDDKELGKLMVERAEIKAAEVKRACNKIGVKDLYFFDDEDGVILPDKEKVKRLARLLRQIRPDVILTHFPYEDGGAWSSHAAAGHLVLMARALAQSVDSGDRNKPLSPPTVFYWGQGAAYAPASIWDARRGIYNEIIIDISDVIELKFECMECLVSQGYAGAYARKRIETYDGAMGSLGGVAYGESFINERVQTHDYLPVTDHTRRLRKMSDHEQIEQLSRKGNFPPRN